MGVKDLRGPFAGEIGFMREAEVGFMPGRVFLPHKAYFGHSRVRYAVLGMGTWLTLLTGLTAGRFEKRGQDAPLPCRLISFLWQEGVMVSIYQAKDHRWRDAFNPLRGLSMPRLVSLLEAGERGQYADLQWFYYYMERSDAMIASAIQRRRSALLSVDWDVRVVAGGDDAGKAEMLKTETLKRGKLKG